MTDFTKLRTKASRGLSRALNFVAPAAKVIKETTSILATVAKPTPITVTNAVVSGLNTLNELIAPDDDSPGWSWPTYLDSGTINRAFEVAGLRREVTGKKAQTFGSSTKTYYDVWLLGDSRVRVDASGRIWGWEDFYATGKLALIAGMIDKVLPPVIKLQPTERENELTKIKTSNLTHLRPKQTEGVLQRTLSLLGERRTILLEGRPGIGKTTMAQAIAADAGLGRVLLLDSYWLMGTRVVPDMFRLMTIGVIVIDDIDKVRPSLQNFERLRESCKLMVLTANNGAHDSVIDGALARPARIDEVFTMTAIPPFQRAPFDRLTPEVWDVVSEWPQAYLNELELRLINTPDDLRLDDLEKRLERRTRSVAGLMPFEPAAKEGELTMVPVHQVVAAIEETDVMVPEEYDE